MSSRNKIRLFVYSFLTAVALLLFFPKNSIDPKLVDYDKEFRLVYQSICGKPLREPRLKVIEFHKLKYPVIGLCMPFYHGFRMYIDPKSFDSFSTADKKALYFHEAMHCYLGQLHLDEETYPENFMNAEMTEINEEELYSQLRWIIGFNCY